MTLFRDLRRSSGRVLVPVAIAAALLAACGGGTSQVQAFKPSRLIVFGDENSLIADDAGSSDGFKYSINDRSTATAGRCQTLPTFVQSVATHYELVFAQCNPLGSTPKAFLQALPLAKIDDPVTGLGRQIAKQGDLNANDMVTVMIGSNDIIELYERSQAGMSTGDAVAEVQRRGSVAAAQVNAILKTGARALVFTIPDLSLSPYAVNAARTNPGATGQLANLTYQFNAYLRTRINATAYDGRNYGLVLADDIVAAMAATPTSYLNAPAAANVAACVTTPVGGTAAAVASAVLACDTTTLVAGASSSSHLWASDRHLGPNAHSRIGSQAVSRASGNPF